jgi:hypothetical protein
MKQVRLLLALSLAFGASWNAHADPQPQGFLCPSLSVSFGLYGGGGLDTRSIDANMTENNNGAVTFANKSTKNKPKSLLGGVVIEVGAKWPKGGYLGLVEFYEYQALKSDATLNYDNENGSGQKYAFKYSTKMNHAIGAALQFGWWVTPKVMPFALVGGGVQFLKTQQQLDAPEADDDSKLQKKDFKKHTSFLRLGLGAMYQWSPKFQLVGQLTTDMYKKLNMASRDNITIDANAQINDKATLKSGMIWKLSLGVRFTFGESSGSSMKS